MFFFKKKKRSYLIIIILSVTLIMIIFLFYNPLISICVSNNVKRFRVKQKLVEHQSVHTGAKPYFCEICDEVSDGRFNSFWLNYLTIDLSAKVFSVKENIERTQRNPQWRETIRMQYLTQDVFVVLSINLGHFYIILFSLIRDSGAVIIWENTWFLHIAMKRLLAVPSVPIR